MRQPLRVYADTSVFGGIFDDEYQTASLSLFNDIRDGRYRLVISSAVSDEMELAPPKVQVLLKEMIPHAEITPVTEDSLRLQKAYLDHNIVGETSLVDALHVALAVVAECDLIVSWNFKHIVNLRRIQLYNAVNALYGYNEIEIRSPRELLSDQYDL